MHDDITDIPNIRVGHDTNIAAGTGCTIIICDTPAIGGVDVRGGAPATRETDLLRPLHMVEEVHAILLTGGAAFGLDAAGGVMRYLEEHNIGFDVGVARVPIVPAAAIFDLGFASPSVRPDAAAGYRACEQATAETLAQGNVGAGTGATVGKLLGPGFMMKGGLGSASLRMDDGTMVGAIVAVNAVGDVIDPQTQQILAGARNPIGGFIASNPFGNTTIAVVATSAHLSKDAINKVAQMAHNGIAQVIRPAHTMFDGDTVFSLSLGTPPQSRPDPATTALKISMIGAAAATTLARAILKAVRSATELHGVPAAQT
ncbi:MAG TPA: peptidase S58 [Ktedonobacter sp.]|jgi:L-aminopeptidase/D-esterase-like protein|nr:peptidase S58 [Ktedonobacter sp.]HAT46175.1 peptidase S58 [Ktedonobacter sp.]HBE25664.1 peptidase S58 [Ktedonobacter sp.]HBE29344.1 peptidase S58 [Ktedonobacter sp.]HCF87013.1 peptidase S58 [Ktedonobacter sp.]